MFSLAGIPPLAGFWGKLTLFGSAIQVAAARSGAPLSVWFTLLVIIGALNAAVATAYYLRIVSVMYFQPSGAAPQAAGGGGALAGTLVCATLVVGIGIFPRVALDAATAAESTFKSRRPAVVAAPNRSAPGSVVDARTR
jgi:NADH-quinone oxidoreductase subunit N